MSRPCAARGAAGPSARAYLRCKSIADAALANAVLFLAALAALTALAASLAARAAACTAVALAAALPAAALTLTAAAAANAADADADADADAAPAALFLAALAALAALASSQPGASAGCSSARGGPPQPHGRLRAPSRWPEPCAAAY